MIGVSEQILRSSLTRRRKDGVWMKPRIWPARAASDGRQHLDKITPTVHSQEVSHMSPNELRDVTKSSCAPHQSVLLISALSYCSAVMDRQIRDQHLAAVYRISARGWKSNYHFILSYNAGVCECGISYSRVETLGVALKETNIQFKATICSHFYIWITIREISWSVFSFWDVFLFEQQDVANMESLDNHGNQELDGTLCSIGRS